MTEIRIDLIGNDKLIGLLIKGGARAATATARAILEEGQIAFAESQRLVPVETGNLRSSGQLIGPTVLGDTVEVTIAYGGADAPYALIVHERLDISHDSPTQAKYLEQPMLRAAEGILARIADRVEEALRGMA